jgi:hypothetical protein
MYIIYWFENNFLFLYFYTIVGWKFDVVKTICGMYLSFIFHSGGQGT